MSINFERIHDFIKEMPIIDSHEHLFADDTKFYSENPASKDFLAMIIQVYGYMDLFVAGCKVPPMTLGNPSIPVMERWKMIEPFWEEVRLTGFFQPLDIAVRDLYGVDRIDGSTIEMLSRQYAERSRPGYCRKVLKEQCRIETVLSMFPNPSNRISDLQPSQDPMFRPVVPLFQQARPVTRNAVWDFGEDVGIHILSIQDLEDACEAFVDRALAKGCVALKYAEAYDRPLSFSRVGRAEAEKVFLQLMEKGEYAGVDLMVLHDYLMHCFLRLCDKREMVFQVHTGILSINHAPNRSKLMTSNPMLMENLFHQYPHVKFDLLHIYPYQDVAASLTKMYANVYLDMAWTHIISPVAATSMLEEWLEAVPKNKITGFGGDYPFCCAEGVYGHQVIARRNIAQALAAKLDAGRIDLPQAKRIAQNLLYDNPKKLFSL